MNPIWYIRLAGVAVVLGLLWAGFSYVKGLGADEVRAELQPSIDTLTTDLASARAELELAKADRAKAQEASRGYQQELTDLRNRPVVRTPVRLCVQSVQAVPAAADAHATGRLDATPTATGTLSGPTGGDLVPGPDIGPELRQLVREADGLSAQVRGLQAYCAGP